MNKEKLYDIIIDRIKSEWSKYVSKDIEYENKIINKPDLLNDYELIRIEALKYDQLRHKGRIDELNDLIEFIEQTEYNLI